MIFGFWTPPWGSPWTRDGGHGTWTGMGIVEPGPGMGIMEPGPRMGIMDPGPGTGLNLDHPRCSTRSRHGAQPGPVMDPNQAGSRVVLGLCHDISSKIRRNESSSKNRRKSDGGPALVEISSKIRQMRHTYFLKKVSMTLHIKILIISLGSPLDSAHQVTPVVWASPFSSHMKRHLAVL